MMRRERRLDGTQVVWTDRVVRVFNADLRMVECRPLTEAERAEFLAWVDTQPDAASWRAMRQIVE